MVSSIVIRKKETNAMFIANEEGNENLVVLDWEDWESVRQALLFVSRAQS